MKKSQGVKFVLEKTVNEEIFPVIKFGISKGTKFVPEKPLKNLSQKIPNINFWMSKKVKFVQESPLNEEI